MVACTNVSNNCMSAGKSVDLLKDSILKAVVSESFIALLNFKYCFCPRTF